VLFGIIRHQPCTCVATHPHPAARFPPAEMRRFADKLHASGQHWAPIFNPGVSVQQGYRAYEEGSAQGLWIKDINGNPYKGQVGTLGTH
jgi:alpha-glucosidase (family GH31 glycosyl hydrolase)